MSTNPPSPQGQQPSDRLDALLSDFFASEFPQPWPPAPLGVTAPAACTPSQPNPIQKSRTALAASLGGLLAFGLLISFLMPGSAPQATGSSDPSIVNQATADGSKLLAPTPPAPNGDRSDKDSSRPQTK